MMSEDQQHSLSCVSADLSTRTHSSSITYPFHLPGFASLPLPPCARVDWPLYPIHPLPFEKETAYLAANSGRLTDILAFF